MCRPRPNETVSGCVGENDRVAVIAGANWTLRVTADTAGATAAFPECRVTDRAVACGTRGNKRTEGPGRSASDLHVDVTVAKLGCERGFRECNGATEPGVPSAGEEDSTVVCLSLDAVASKRGSTSRERVVTPVTERFDPVAHCLAKCLVEDEPIAVIHEDTDIDERLQHSRRIRSGCRRFRCDRTV